MASGLRRKRPPGQRARDLANCGLRVGRNRLVVAIQPQAAVLIELPQADREQLQQLARVVLVRRDVVDDAFLLYARSRNLPIVGLSVTSSSSVR